MSDKPQFADDVLLRVGETDFHCALQFGNAPAGRIPVMKSRDLVERYIDLSQRWRPEVIVELGIKRGGSTALLHALNHPDKLIAVEIDPTTQPALRSYVEEHALSAVVRPHYGVDQADGPTLARIMADELGGRPIDLVIDDASHRYEETLASFEALFPLVRPGGLFVIEDWRADHIWGMWMAATLEDESSPRHGRVTERFIEALEHPGQRRIPLTRLVMELVVARSSEGDAFRELTINGHWVVVHRGDEELDPASFRLGDHVHDLFGFTTDEPRPSATS